MREYILTAAAIAALFVTPPVQAQTPSPAPYINLVELVVIPSELSKFLELAKENAATAIKEPGVREFNIMQLASNPNHVVLYEVYENEAALNAHRATDHPEEMILYATAPMVAERNIRVMAAVAVPYQPTTDRAAGPRRGESISDDGDASPACRASRRGVRGTSANSRHRQPRPAVQPPPARPRAGR